jgi:hypothetical protein
MNTNKEMAVQSSDKWRFTLYTVVILVLVFNHYTFKFVNSVLGRFMGPTADKNGCPTMLGFALHVVVFTLLLRASMEMR